MDDEVKLLRDEVRALIASRNSTEALLQRAVELIAKLNEELEEIESDLYRLT